MREQDREVIVGSTRLYEPTIPSGATKQG